MKILLTITMALGIFLIAGANQNAEARSRFSFYLGGPTYVAPAPYYVAPPTYYVAPPTYYVAPPQSYYVAPQPQCYQVLSHYGPYGPVYRTVCH